MARVPVKAKNSMSLAAGGQEGPETQDWFSQQPSSQPAKPPAQNPSCPCHPHRLLYVQEASGQPSATGRMGWAEERLGCLSWKQLSAPSKQRPLAMPCSCPHPGSQTPRYKHYHPQTTGGSLRVWPPNLLSLPPLSWAEEGVARQGKGNTQVAPHSGGTPL